jgi:hypothetical protein
MYTHNNGDNVMGFPFDIDVPAELTQNKKKLKNWIWNSVKVAHDSV